MSKEPPVGRIGYVLAGFGDGTTTSDNAREIRCNGCRTWFDARYVLCTECGHARPGFNKEIRTKQLNRNLYEQAARNR